MRASQRRRHARATVLDAHLHALAQPQGDDCNGRPRVRVADRIARQVGRDGVDELHSGAVAGLAALLCVRRVSTLRSARMACNTRKHARRSAASNGVLFSC